MDDFLIHAPTLIKAEMALTAFMTEAFAIGLLCHPAKLIKTCQRVKFCGLELDTQAIPSLSIPEYKRSRTTAALTFVLATPPGRTISGNVMAVLTGTLEALVEATPSRIGANYIRALYDCVSSCRNPSLPLEYQRVFAHVHLSPEARQDMEWWLLFFATNEPRVAYLPRAHLLSSFFGDGSGQGAGGTITVGDSDNRRTLAWMGASTDAASTSSNWKELTTVLTGLQYVAANLPRESQDIRHTTVHYFCEMNR
jgi:hypothetical protein